MKRIFLLIITFTILLSSTAQARQLGIYAGGRLGYSDTRYTKNELQFESGTTTYGDRDYGLSNFSSDSLHGGAVVGYDFSKRFDLPLRVDFEIMARSGEDRRFINSFELTNGHIWNTNLKMEINSAYSFMLNGWVDIPVGAIPLKPYVGAGAGIIGFSYESTLYSQKNGGTTYRFKEDESAGTWAVSLGGGLGFNLTEHFTLDLGYRYIYSGKIEAELTDFVDEINAEFRMRSHDISMGLRYTF